MYSCRINLRNVAYYYMLTLEPHYFFSLELDHDRLWELADNLLTLPPFRDIKDSELYEITSGDLGTDMADTIFNNLDYTMNIILDITVNIDYRNILPDTVTYLGDYVYKAYWRE